MTTTCYAIAALGSDGKPAQYLPFYGEGWTPGTAFRLQSDPVIAWRFGNGADRTGNRGRDECDRRKQPGTSRHRNRLRRTTSHSADAPHRAVTTTPDDRLGGGRTTGKNSTKLDTAGIQYYHVLHHFSPRDSCCPVSIQLAVFAINLAVDGLAADSQCSWYLQICRCRRRNRAPLWNVPPCGT